MKYALIMVLSFVISLCFALDSQPGSGLKVWPEEVREYSFSYHNGTDDYHFYGSNTWAVRFNFAELYPEALGSKFEVTKALLWLPQTGDSVRVELFSEYYGGPGTSLASAKVAVTSNQLEIPFANTVQGDSLWLVVTYNTNFANRFVAASTGGGTHSYYWNTNNINPYFQSLAAAGFNAELLFGLAGDFVLGVPDLQLVDFDLEGVLQPQQLVGPIFTVYNHSDIAVSDAKVHINIYSPSPDFARADSILITESIPPRSQYVFNIQNHGFASHQVTLPDEPTQLKLRAVLSSAALAGEPTGNNSLLLHRFSFNEVYPVYLVENFLRTENSAQITAMQDQYEFENIHVLNYFPVLSDSLANVASQIRYNWYSFNTLPRTAVNGDLRLGGFSPDYSEFFEQQCQSAQTQRSFVASSRCDFQHVPQNDMLTTTLTLSNDKTRLYTAATEYNLINATRLSIGLFRKVTFDGMERWVIQRWFVHGASLSGPLGFGESLNLSFNVSLSNLSLAELAENYRLYYWLQIAGGGRILYSAYSDFTGVVPNHDEVWPVTELRVSPNPLRVGGWMRISLARGQKMGSAKIYNLRGQKIMDLQSQQEEITLSASEFPASGIYLLQVQVPSPKGGMITINKKINIIK